MMNKLKYLTLLSLKRKIKTKWFLGANILLFIVIAGLINIDSVVKFFGGDFEEKQVIYVVDNSNKTYEVLKSKNDNYISIIDVNDDSKFVIKKSLKDYKTILKKNPEAWVLILSNSDNNIIDAKLISNDYISSSDYVSFSTILNLAKSDLALKESNIDKDDLAKISNPVNIEREVLDKSKNSKDENARMILSTLFPFLVLPFFALTLFLVQMIGAEVNDEKTTRGMEIIISNVSPKIHLFSKVLAGNLFVLFQGLLMVIFGLVGVLIRMNTGSSKVSLDTFNLDINGTISNFLTSDVGMQLNYIIPLTLVMIILTFIAYSFLAGILASMTTNIEDFQQLQTPITIISLLGYYLAVMSGMFEGALFIKIAAFIPFISAILAPCLLLLGQFSITEFVIAIILVILVIFLLIKYGFRIYKQGILNYSSKNLWKKMFAAMKVK